MTTSNPSCNIYINDKNLDMYIQELGNDILLSNPNAYTNYVAKLQNLYSTISNSSALTNLENCIINNIPPTYPPTTTPSSSGMSAGVIVAIIFVVLAIIGVIIAYFYKDNIQEYFKGKNTHQDTKPSLVSPTPSRTPEETMISGLIQNVEGKNTNKNLVNKEQIIENRKAKEV